MDKRQRVHARKHRCNGPDVFDILDILPYIMIPTKELKATFEEAAKKAEATEQRRVEEKVNSWLKESAP